MYKRQGLLGDIGGLFLRLCGRTTVSGATQLNARIQLYTREGHLVLDRVVEGDVGFTGGNSRATHNLAHNVAVTLKRSTLPDTAIVDSEQETASLSNYQVGTITAAQCHQAAHADTRVTSCEVSLRVGDTAFGVLYAAPVGMDNVRYETGRELLVLVGEDTITYNDMLGLSLIHIYDNTNRCGTRDFPSFFRGRDWWLLPVERQLSWFGCCPAFQTHAPAERAAIWAGSREECPRPHRGTASPGRPVRGGQPSVPVSYTHQMCIRDSVDTAL